MFTLEQVNGIHEELGKSNSLLEYANALRKIGVMSYDSSVSDGRTKYYGKDGYVVETPPHHKEFIVAEAYNDELFRRTLKRAEKGKIGYEEMAKELAKAGVEKWSMDTDKHTFTYSDIHGKAVLVEQLR